MKTIPHLVILALFAFLFSNRAKAQYDPAAINLLVYYYPALYSESESSLGVDRMIEKKINELLKESNEGFVTYTITQPTEITFMAFDRKHSDPRIYQVLMEKDGYTLLCQRVKENPCDCRGSYLYMLTAEHRMPKSVERPLLFSIRKSLIRELNESHGYQLDESELETYCDLMERLKVSED